VLETLSKDRFRLRVVPGLQADWFDQAVFYDQDFTVSPALDRMGIRLQGRPLPLPERELVSEPVCPGAVQVTGDGQCIVLGVDGQTIGGYPKIAQVIQADLDHLGQMRPGDKIHFRQIELAEAAELYRSRRAFLREWTMRARVSLDGA
jgi:allophanate hydrolase subunit 2